MNEPGIYVYSLIALSVASGIAITLCPENGNIKKYVKYLCALMIALCLVSPIKNVGNIDIRASFDTMDRVDYDDDNITGQMILEETKIRLSEELSASLTEKYGDFFDGCEFMFDESDLLSLKLKCVNVRTDADSAFLIHDVKTYVEKEYGCRCEVIKPGENAYEG